LKNASKKQDQYQIYLNDDFFLKERIINFSGGVGQESVKDLQKKLLILIDDNDKLPIKIFINSYGGDIYAALGLYDFIKSLNVEIIMYNTGLCASAATIIYLAGDHRYATENTRFMFHKPSGSVSGGPQEFVSEGEEMTWIYGRMIKIYETETKKNASFWKRSMAEANFYIDKKQAFDLGVSNVL
jgi:ATP-dependent Clp protease protease subunit